MHAPWANSTIYQIFPLSFFDSNNDGKGDINGIIQKLPYLVDLGVNTIWLNPIYKSTWYDAGYDCLDHTAIDPIFGTIHDFDQLIAAAHRLSLKVMIDLIASHTSDEHPWFLESASSLHNPKRDWYTWRNPATDGSPPNNWRSVFGGSAWTFDATTKQYYLHTFYPNQPDLNLSNPHVRSAIAYIVRYYLDRGVDALRVDAASHFAKDPHFRDNPFKINYQQIADPYEQQQHLYDKNLPARFDYINELSSQIDQFSQSFMVTESYLDLNQLREVFSNTPLHNHTACNFNLVDAEIDPKKLTKWINTFLAICHKKNAVPTWILGNHDRQRVASHYGPEVSRVLAMLQCMLPGVAFIYMGDELGMTETPIPPDQRRDLYSFHSRDAQRTPMQWSSEPYAGFSKAKPWLPVNPNYQTVNVEAQQSDPHSTLSFYQHLLKLRQRTKPSAHLRLELLHKSVIVFSRGSNKIYLNFSDKPINLNAHVTVTLSTQSHKKGEVVKTLRPFEGVITNQQLNA